jgi:hypothetical protein
LAARHATQLAARPNLAGPDFFYLRRLYDIADKGDEVVRTLRRFLAEQTTPKARRRSQRVT